MELKQQLLDFGCSDEFIEIALGYETFYDPAKDIEEFIEYVEEEYAKVEEELEAKKRQSEMVNASEIMQEFTDQED